MPQPPIRGEPIVHGVPTGVPEPKFFSEPQAPKRTHVFEASPSAEESTILLSTLQQLRGRLENLENRTSANSTTNPCVPYNPSPHPSVHRACRCASWSQVALCTPYQSTQTRGVLYHYLRSIHPRPSSRPLRPLAPMALLPDPIQPVPHTGRGTKAFFKPQTETKLPKFSGRDLDVYAEDFLRFLRSTGQEILNKADLVINGCDNKRRRAPRDGEGQCAGCDRLRRVSVGR